jgi:hypothetical protein
LMVVGTWISLKRLQRAEAAAPEARPGQAP